ncbi:hypothetical protein ACPC54_35280 [Kitasatospora sp. NPDC094028]
MAWHPRNDADPGHRWFREHLAAAVLLEHGDGDGEEGGRDG